MLSSLFCVRPSLKKKARGTKFIGWFFKLLLFLRTKQQPQFALFFSLSFSLPLIKFSFSTLMKGRKGKFFLSLSLFFLPWKSETAAFSSSKSASLEIALSLCDSGDDQRPFFPSSLLF